ncbi:MAG: phosphoenolpyruvate synthase [Candidatus Kerfeldbacteria bacterium]|nr:phosphoenolpyruvate synthase [Candidatus Kerfeldbacteria bacterium]
MAARSRPPRFVRWFKNLRNKDVKLVGGKNASLGEMYSLLTPRGVRIPNGFAVTAEAYFYFLKQAGIQKEIRRILRGLDTSNLKDLAWRGAKVRQTILRAQLPPDLEQAIVTNYRQLEREFGWNVDVAVRSSATAEDLPDASFAGQQETYLDVRGAAAVVQSVKKCFASLFTNRAISYRHDKGFDHFTIGLSAAVQKMVRSDKACAGVMFSIDTETGFRNAVLVTGSWGLGENTVLGRVNPDEYFVFKPSLATKKKAILARQLGDKRTKLVYTTDPKHPTKNVAVSRADRLRFILTDREVEHLARWAVLIEKHYRRPMDMEWAKDGISGQLYIVQARPETVHALKSADVLEEYHLPSHRAKVLVTGSAVGAKIGVGRARVILDVKHISQFKPGEVLVTDMTDPDWEPIMKMAAAIVTNRGGRTAHAAIISRELGIPAIVGTVEATRKVQTGHQVTADCSSGSVGKVYAGALSYRVVKHNLKALRRTPVKVMMNVGNPEQAFAQSFIPNDGVGLAREEFITASWIGVHPMALLRYPKLKDDRAKRQIERLTRGYADKRDFYLEKLTSGVAMIAAAFYPKDVILRLSDFKTNEYATLVGGREFEPVESNPMMGWRGAARYYAPAYRQAFRLELEALRRVRNEMGLTNLKIMIPMCRTVAEGREVLRLLAAHSLKRGVNDLEVYCMVEVPANVILIRDFAKIFDGFSIGSNDLTQFTLAVDRDSELVSHIYDEHNPAVKQMLAQAIQGAKAAKRKIGICGQAPSDYPDIAQFLVAQGIDSISLNPDTVIKTRLLLNRSRKVKG